MEPSGKYQLDHEQPSFCQALKDRKAPKEPDVVFLAQKANKAVEEFGNVLVGLKLGKRMLHSGLPKSCSSPVRLYCIMGLRKPEASTCLDSAQLTMARPFS
ncbi:hypothetical protein [Sporisorium scitamineum]|uniref:Uncharacterized protein n=1 Tax=Sporisorium scitamineum TaxID=49012 RepID=A0A0F7RZX4_9BASI|nr:hypothetical protein [Sporisorium scitamineum]